MKLFNIKSRTRIAVFALGSLFTALSCVNDLEREPITDVTSASVYKDFANYNSLLAKLYGNVAVGGQGSGDGNSDISGIDGGFSNYLRQLYTLQVITTDEAIIGWNDGNLPDIHRMNWNASNEFINALYYRLYTEVAFTNEFLRNTTDEKLAANGITGENAAEVKFMRGEARFLRAQAYYHALDLFGNVPFVKETDLPGTALPTRITRPELFAYVESELKLSETEMRDAKTGLYGRANKAAAWALLARLYLNSKVYTGTERNNEVISYAEKIINAGYSLKTEYDDLFLADNHINNNEVILPIVYDGAFTQTNGGTTFLVHAAVGGTMPAADFGINGGWGGIRTTKNFVNLFQPTDLRGRFYTSGQNLEINSYPGDFTDGYAFIKYKNVTSSGVAGVHDNWVSTDIPLYRLADVYLMYAEATLRGGNGNLATALNYVNMLRTRANAGTVSALTLDFILDERSRELSWEFTRRTDLIRYGRFTSAAYLWPWKGGIKDGKAVEEYRNLFPIPANDVIANPNLIQNPGY